MYDMKPGAPSEIRGEFRPIKTNVPGMQVRRTVAAASERLLTSSPWFGA
jgi:hypothetical protein